MKAAAVGWVVVVLAASLAGCSDLMSATVSDDGARSMLEQRAVDLKQSIIATGRITSAQHTAISQLVTDIKAFQARTGRTDIAVSTSAPKHAAVNLAVVSPGTGSGSCTPCPPVTASGGKICFLFEDGGCDSSSGLTLKVCAYVCITLDPGATPIKRR